MERRRAPPHKKYTGVVRIITTHLGADFDALGAVFTAQLLDPEARVVFPGSQEAAVRRFLEAERVELPEVRVRELRRATIEHAIVVDCSSLRRLGEVGALVAAAACPVEVYDHHPDSEDPIPGARVIAAPVAATCTVLAEEIRRQGHLPDRLTASLGLMGIYEDTGGLAYVDTTPRDLRAAAWLLGAGGRLEWVRRYVLRPLEPEQLELLNQLVEGAVEHQVGGVRVVVTVARPAAHTEEAAYVLHRYAEIFDLPVVIALLEVPPQLVVIARSAHPRVDAGRLLRRLGGGGHATAAAARVRGRSAVELAESLLAALRRRLAGGWTASALATATVHTCPAADTVAAAKERLVRLRINAMPVEEAGRFVGAVTRQVLDNALAGGLGERPVTAVMRPEVPVVRPDAPVEEVERTFMEVQSRFVLVPLGTGWGIITRMDLLRRLYERQVDAGTRVDRRLAGTRAVSHDIGHLLRRRLAPGLRDVLRRVGEVADELSLRSFLVGGAVRDLLLGRRVEDVDIVVEGDGVELARALEERLGGRAHIHDPFKTAVVTLPGGLRLDIATARTEFYRFPAALPEVVSSAVRQDLYRRDFTINAMAIRLSGGRFGELLDFFGGQRDLQRRQLRILHSLSFLDDPTRAIRAVRFATRLGLEIAPETRQLVATAVQEGVFTRLTGERLREELSLLLEASHPTEGLAELDRLGVWGEIFPGVAWGTHLRRLLLDVEVMLAWSRMEGVYEGQRWPVFLAAVATRGGENAGAAVARRLVLAGTVGDLVAQARVRCEQVLAAASRSRPRPSELVAVLERTEPALWVVAMALGEEPARRVLREALTGWLRQPPPVTGAALVAAGVAPGPAVGEAVRRARAAALDGELADLDPLEYAVAWARTWEGGTGAGPGKGAP